MKTKKIFFTMIFAVIFFFAVAAFCGVAIKNGTAAGEIMSEPRLFSIEEGASVRLKEGETGLRFRLSIAQEDYEELSEISTTVFLYPENGEENASEQVVSWEVSETQPGSYEMEGRRYVNVVLTEIPETNYGTDISCYFLTTYKKSGEEYTETSDTMTRSLAEVSLKALADDAANGKTKYTQEQKVMLCDFAEESVGTYLYGTIGGEQHVLLALGPENNLKGIDLIEGDSFGVFEFLKTEKAFETEYFPQWQAGSTLVSETEYTVMQTPFVVTSENNYVAGEYDITYNAEIGVTTIVLPTEKFEIKIKYSGETEYASVLSASDLTQVEGDYQNTYNGYSGWFELLAGDIVEVYNAAEGESAIFKYMIPYGGSWEISYILNKNTVPEVSAKNKNMIEDFAEESRISVYTGKIKGFSENDAIYHSEFEGRNGVIEVDINNPNNPVFCFDFTMTQDEFQQGLENCEYIALSVYVDGEGTFTPQRLSNFAAIQGKSWQEIRIKPTTNIWGAWDMQNFAYQMTSSAGENKLFALIGVGNYKVYIDWIAFVSKSDMIEDFGNESSISVYNGDKKGFSSNSAVFHSEYAGRRGVIEIVIDTKPDRNFSFCFSSDLKDKFAGDSWEAIAVTLYIAAEGTYTCSMPPTSVGSIKGNTWTTILLTRENVDACGWYWSFDNFANCMTDSGFNNYLFYLDSAVGESSVFVDSIAFIPEILEEQ